jgi:RND family efflux transporter MFP subunit
VLPALASIVVLGALAGCSKGEGAAAAETAPTEVTVGRESIALAETSQIRSGPSISGTLEPEWSATVRAEVAGAVLQTSAEAGQRVAQGAVLARLDDVVIRDAFLSARQAVSSAQATAETAQRNAERTAALAQAGAVAERDLEAARTQATAASAQLADARARLAQAEKQLAKTQVRAPRAGIVSERQVQAGDVVQPGGALFTIVDPSRMKLEASVPAAQLSAVRVGSPVEFTVTGYAEPFTGKVARINPVADPSTGQVRIQVAIPNTAGSLVGGLFAEGRVASETRTGVVVPVLAVNQRGVRPTAMRLRGGKVEQVEVQLGLQDDRTDRVEIAQGVAAGDTLLLGTAQGIAAGTPVRVGGPVEGKGGGSR